MVYTFKRGTHPDGNKEHTKDKSIEVLKAPEYVVLPVSMHIGAPAKVIVNPGDTVKLGQMVAEAGGFVSAPVHATVSGTVTKVEPRLHPNGTKVMSVVIENDFNDTWDESVKPFDYENMTQDELCDALAKSGIVGHGGAAFPTHVKVKSGIGKIDTIIINGAECEPYITSDHRLLLERPEEIVAGIEILMKIFGVRNAKLAIEKNKSNTFERIEELLAHNDGIELCPLEVKYPQGAEKQLIYAITHREVPSKKLPADAGCAVFNVDTCGAIYRYFALGQPMYRRIVTVSGSAISNPKNLEVRIGTPVTNLIEQCGGFVRDPYKLLMGGPMMGVSQFTTDIPVFKGTNAFLAFDKSGDLPKPGQCIRCGRCVDVCPMNLTPTYLYHMNEKDNLDGLIGYNTMDCIECGACTYICPAKLPLVQGIRAGKHKIQASQPKK
ncbi:MAG: electron transport complex subunit RsxC [Clostridia bacterium]|nr:electron transport complex subunit RsxC [Clostridia bacterium]